MKKFNIFSMAVFVFLSLSLTATAQQNPIQAENSLPGTYDWQIPISLRAVDHQIEGYASQTSVNVGERIRFHIKADSPRVYFYIYRLGYYNGAGGRLVYSSRAVDITYKAYPIPDSQTGLAECNWVSSPTEFWDVPTDAVSGVYLVKLVNSANSLSSYISFVVREDARASDVLFQRSVTTDQAYNTYPQIDGINREAPGNGKSLYEGGSGGLPLPGRIEFAHQARKVSFNRPYGVLSDSAPTYEGVYQTAGGSLFKFDYNMIRWLEKNGYDVTYCTDIDTHTANATNGRLAAGRHKTFLSVGHDEYWSWEMRDNVEQARNRLSQPLNLGFFTGNACYWQIRFEDSSSNSNPASASNRTIVAYKQQALDARLDVGDPFYNDGIAKNNHLITNLWRENQSNEEETIGERYQLASVSKPPEDELIGVMWSIDPVFCCTPVNTVVIAASSPSWITQGTTGQQLNGLLGYEADRLYPENYYPDRILQIVGASPYLRPNGSNAGDSHMTFYTRNDNNARVFATGTIQWSWGLDNFNADAAVGPITRDPYRKQDAETITTNVLGCLINGVCS